MSNTTLFVHSGNVDYTGTPTSLSYNVDTSYATGDTVLYLGYQVKANATITAGTAFSWGTTGATWSPVQFGTTWKGVYAGGTSYLANDVVSSDTTSTAMYKSLAGSNLGNALSNTLKWEAASFTVAAATSIPMLAYQIGETYYVGQHVCYNGLIVTPNATVPAGTVFAWGSTGATFRIDIDSTGAFYVVNTEYVSPNQHGNIYGKVYRTYFGSTLPAYLTTGNAISKVLTYEIGYQDAGLRRRAGGIAPNMVSLELAGTTGKSNLQLSAAGGFTITDGWVDYTK